MYYKIRNRHLNAFPDLLEAKIPTAQRGSPERIPSGKAHFLKKAISQQQLFEKCKREPWEQTPQSIVQQGYYLNAHKPCWGPNSRKKVPFQKLHVDIPLLAMFPDPGENTVIPFRLLIVLIFPAVVSTFASWGLTLLFTSTVILFASLSPK